MNDNHKIPTQILQLIDTLRIDHWQSDLENSRELQNWIRLDPGNRAKLEKILTRSRALDQSIAGSFGNIEVPAGLQNRLLESVRQMPAKQGAKSEMAGIHALVAAASDESAAGNTIDQQPYRSPHELRTRESASRRHEKSKRWMSMAGAISTVSAMLVFGVIVVIAHINQPRCVTQSELCRDSVRWLSQLENDTLQAQRPTDLDHIPSCDDIREEVRFSGFARVETEFGPALGAVAKVEGGKRCYLFSFREDNADVQFLVGQKLPDKPISTPGKPQSMAAVRDEGYVHVLILDQKQDYGRVVKRKPTEIVK